MTPDYSSYSVAELLEARGSIDASRHPANKAALDDEIRARMESGEFEAEQQRAIAEFERSNAERIAFAREARLGVAWYLIVTAPIMLYFSFTSLPAVHKGVAVAIAGFALLYAALAVLAGVQVLRRRPFAHRLTIAVLACQLIRIESAPLFMSLLSAVGGFLTVGQGGAFGVAAHIDPGLRVQFEPGGPWLVGINGLALFVIALLAIARDADADAG